MVAPVRGGLPAVKSSTRYCHRGFGLRTTPKRRESRHFQCLRRAGCKRRTHQENGGNATSGPLLPHIQMCYGGEGYLYGRPDQHKSQTLVQRRVSPQEWYRDNPLTKSTIRYPDDNGKWEWSSAENRWKGNPMTSDIVQRYMQSLRTKNKLTATVNHAAPVTFEDMRALFAYSYRVSPPGSQPTATEPSIDRYYAMLFRHLRACRSLSG